MQENETMRVNVDPDIEETAKFIFALNGLSPEQAIALFYQETVYEGGLPFRHDPVRRHPLLWKKCSEQEIQNHINLSFLSFCRGAIPFEEVDEIMKKGELRIHEL